MLPELEMPSSEQSVPSVNALRILFVIPGDGVGASMIFARRQVDAMGRLGILIRSFYFRERSLTPGCAARMAVSTTRDPRIPSARGPCAIWNHQCLSERLCRRTNTGGHLSR